MRENVKKLRCVAATSVGTICAVMYPFIKGVLWVICFKIGLFAIMCIILYFRLSKFGLHCLMFLIATALLGGVQFMVGYVVFGNAYDALTKPISDLPVSIFFFPPLVMFFAAKKILDALNAHRLKENYIYDMKLTVENCSLALKGLVDTGNQVKANKDVVFINRVTALKLLGGKYFKFAESDDSRLSIHTAAGAKNILLLPGKIELYSAEDEHIFMDVQVGIGDIKTNGDYEALLPLSILGKEKTL